MPQGKPPARKTISATPDYSHLDLPQGELWIFGYGSLMWNPGMPYERREPGLVFGYHRALCVYSPRWRGTLQRPGLVMGLDRGGACRGITYRIAAAHVPGVLELLWEREMERARVSYVPLLLNVITSRGHRPALAFVADRNHPCYAGKLGVQQTARLVATRRGERGPNIEYLEQTVRHLAELGVSDRRLQRILDAARRLARA